MQRNSRFSFIPFALLLLSTVLILSIPTRPVETPAPAPAPCLEKTACSEPGNNTSDDLMLENLSRQFILVSPVN